MTIFEYVALNNPVGAKNVLNSFGQKAVPRPDILAKQLANAVNQYGKDALYRIASVHPDLELINQYSERTAELDSEKEEAKEKSCGCNDKKEESPFSSIEGQEIKRAVEEINNKQNAINNAPKDKSDKTELLIIGAIAIVGLALVLKK